jgi:MFS family permease
LMAAVYAVFVPLVEIPSGIVADRWSRRGILIVASLASMLSALVGGLSYDVPTYFVSALILGIYFALVSGTFESVVYDTVLEETGDSKEFEKSQGRAKLFNSIGGLIAAVTGGTIAALFDLRTTYFVTIITVGISVLALLKFREPQLHKMNVASSLKDHIVTTYKTILKGEKLLPVIALLVLTSMLIQVMLEFGQVWLVTLETPTVFYGFAFAGLTAAIGFGGALAGRIKFHKTLPLAAVAATLTVSSLAMIFVREAITVTIAQIVMATLIVVISILATRLMHDATASEVRSGVASGVSAFSWMVFVPFSILFGWVSNEYSVFNGGWLIFAIALIACSILIKIARDRDSRIDVIK